jgi:hypothetical protein
MGPFDSVREVIEQAKSFGYRELKSGARLFGHVPHVAPEAWLHQVYAPLSERDCDLLEQKVEQPLPVEFREFLSIANGLGLFSNTLSIYGQRASYGRSGDEVWQPFSIVDANTFDRPRHAKQNQLIVGSYRSDGSLVFIDGNDGHAYQTRARSAKVLKTWSGFWQMLTSETERISKLFDNTGHRLAQEDS